MGCCSSKAAGKYEDYDWGELPVNAKDAATKLGYTKKMWDKDKEPETMEKDWADLTQVEKDAAAVLGYNEELWDESSSSSSSSDEE